MISIIKNSGEGHIPSSFSIVDIIDYLYGNVLKAQNTIFWFIIQIVEFREKIALKLNISDTYVHAQRTSCPTQIHIVH